MFANRITRFLPSQDRLPQVASECANRLAPANFVQAPAFAAGGPSTYQISVYQVAYEAAQQQVAARRRLRQLQRSEFSWN
jgi:hypothetical protein